MIEETIEKMISDWYLSTPRDISELSEQLLEQHEAEMVLFADWVEDNFNCDGKNDKGENIYVYIGDGKFYTATDLLTLFKNRNK